MINKVITSFLLIAVLSVGFIMPRKSYAFWGFGDIVSDIGHTLETAGGWLAEQSRFVLQESMRIALATLKKRLLDSLVDETIRYIQGEGKPRFLTDPKGYFEDSFQAAIGDTTLALGMGRLCSGSLYYNLQLQLVQPVFSQQVQCTLDDIVGNIESFAQDFRTGGWLGYQELLAPQNNRYGLEWMVQDELLRQKGESKALAQYEATVGQGFYNEKVCDQWTAMQDTETAELGDVLSGRDYWDRSPDGKAYNGQTNTPLGSAWSCTASRIITPGSTLGETVAKAIGSDIEYIVNADELSAYTAAIVDAAINRLTKESLEGLAGLFSTPSNELTPPQANPNRTSSVNCEDLSGTVQEACEAYRGTQEQFAEEARDQLLNTFSNADDELTATQDLFDTTVLTNTQIIATLGDLLVCEDSAGQIFEPDAETLLADAETRGEAGGELEGLQLQIVDLQDRAAELGDQIFEATQEELPQVTQGLNSLRNDINTLAFSIQATQIELQDILSQVRGHLNSCQAALP